MCVFIRNVERLVCSRLISCYRSRQSRITRIILRPTISPIAHTRREREREGGREGETDTLLYGHMSWVFASLRRQHSAGLAFLCAPRPVPRIAPWPTETLCSWLYRKRFAKHNMTTARPVRNTEATLKSKMNAVPVAVTVAVWVATTEARTHTLKHIN